MIYRIYPQKDTTIYEDSTRKLQNVGKDEILEVGKFFDTDDTTLLGSSRILIQFNLSQISQSINNGTISGSIKYYLNLISSDEREIPSEYDLYIYPISQSWSEGVGSLPDTPHNENDSNWVYRSTNVSWSVQSPINSGSYWSINAGGGTWFTSSVNGTIYSQSFSRNVSDLNIEITQYVNDIFNGIRQNNGFIIKRSNADEASSIKYGVSKYFSTETHTIWVPTLEVKWNDSQFQTGSLSALTSENIVLYTKGLKSEYKQDSKDRIRVYGRERYPQRTFGNSGALSTVKYLPTSSYWSLIDVETELEIIPFDTTYTKIECDSTSNYFDFWFNSLQPERYYKFVFRIDSDGLEKYYDNDFYFKVVR
jgi:hypothetical protein